MNLKIFDSARYKEPKSGYGLMSANLKDNLSKRGHQLVEKEEDVWLWIRPPHYLKYPEFNPDKVNIIYTMCEEEKFEGWKSDWPQLLNKATAIITPTEWNKQVFIKQGVTKPIHVVPLGVNSKIFSGFKPYHFSILTLHDNLGGDSSRELWKDTLQAYYNTFSGKRRMNNAVLTIKSYNIKRDEFYGFMESIKPEYAPPVEVLELDLVPQDLNNLYAMNDLFIKNADREGWSLPLLEAMSVNLAVAYTNLPVFEWAQGYWNKHVFEKGDIDGLSKIMEGQFNLWKKRKSFINSLSWKECARKVEEVLLQYAKKED